MLPGGDSEFIQIVDHALADAAARSGDWLACRPGCNQCCHGVFRIGPLDTERLRAGLALLEASSPDMAASLRKRVAEAINRLTPDFPGDPATGILNDEDEAFEEFANEDPCPVLNPVTGTCDLYQHRPITCRTFGPPVRVGEGFAVCELCFVDAPPAAVEAGEMHLPPADMEEELNRQTGRTGDTIVAFALRDLR
jgi:Fe-S-cluster containining protein